jgi:flagellin
MPVINTNINALIARQSLTVNGRKMTDTMEQLSTGKRITSAADDAAGLSIASKMTSQIRGLNQAVRNANDGISMMQTAEGALNEVTNMFVRMRELAVQTANGTNSTSDKAALQAEFAELQSEVSRIGNNTQWNGTNILSASSNVAYQIGANSGQTVTVTFKGLVDSSDSMSAIASAVAANLSAGTANAIGLLDSAIQQVNTYRGDLGAKMNRLTYAADNAVSISTNTAASRSRIEDADYAQATTELARTQIIQQAGTAMLSQANQTPYSVLALLK